jgi:hypothetical protein
MTIRGASPEFGLRLSEADLGSYDPLAPTMSPASVKGPPVRQWHGTGLGVCQRRRG